jgi:hypothetical protein
MPDGRYFIVLGRLWRMSNPGLAPNARQELVDQLMNARSGRRHQARFGEHGPVWWTDGAPDFNQRLVINTPYAGWYARLLPSDSN